MNRLLTWVIIGNPENRRVALFQQALASRGQPAATVLSYEGLLTGRQSVESIPQGAIVRIESPGENFAVEKLLLAAGAEAAEQEGVPFITGKSLGELRDDHGLIRYPRQWYLGFLKACDDWIPRAYSRNGITTTTPSDVRVIFDKSFCSRACAAVGLPVPRSLGTIVGFDDLIERVRDSSTERVFVKLANSSSASGVVALYIRPNAVEAITSVELVRAAGETRLYNSLKIRRYTSLDDVRDLIDTLVPHRVHVEEWLPKASINRRLCDVRVVVVAGEPMQMVVRTSRSPLTNLHLGNRRGELDELLAKIPEPVAVAMRDTCRRCSQLFADSFHLGLDILFTPGFRHHYLLEVNAFGDLLPKVLHHGRDTYQSQIDAMIQSTARLAR